MLRRLMNLTMLLGALGTTLWGADVQAQRRVRTVRVNVESQPPGATVYVDDPASAPLGTTPLRNVRIPRGRHTLIFKLAGHADATLAVDARRHRETFRAELRAQSVIEVTAAHEDTAGAAVRIDGQPVGNVPHREIVEPGRHMVQVSREGFVTFTQWVELQGGQVLTLPVRLERERPRTGSLLVAADVNGAEVLLDGEVRGTTPTLIEDVPAGQHRVEVRAPGLEPRQETVLVEMGRRATVTVRLRPEAPPSGSLVIAANVTGAVVTVDGEVRGRTPVTLTEIPVGEHIVEISAEGYQAAQRTVTVEEGTQRALQIELTAAPRPPGQIVVRSTTEGATVLVDGEERGVAPVIVRDVGEGTHAIVVRADGYRDYRTTCRVAPGQDCEIDAELVPRGVAVRVTANARGAVLVVDGQEVGPLPYEGEVPAGTHSVEVRAPGHRPHRETLRFVPAPEPRTLEVALLPDGPTPEDRAAELAERRRIHRGTVTHTGAVLPDDQVALDVSVGWPYAVQARLGIGIFRFLDAGVTIRSFVRMTEFEGRVRLGYRPIERVSVGLQGRIGGGVGLRKANTGFFSIEGLSTLHFADRAAATLVVALDFSSDDYPYAETDHDTRLMTGGRQNLWRFRLGLRLDAVVTRYWNLFGQFDAIAAQTDDGRRLYGDVFGGGREDRGLYARFGFTYKF